MWRASGNAGPVPAIGRSARVLSLATCLALVTHDSLRKGVILRGTSVLALSAGWLKRGLVFAFVTWHLVFLSFRNPMDLWWRDLVPWTRSEPAWKEYKIDKLDEYTSVYGNVLGIEQGWRMFGSPLARSTSFPAVRLEFADGSSAITYAQSEPDLPSYWRLGDCRQRKLEGYLASWSAEDGARSIETPLWANYVWHIHRRWQAAHPDDRREPARLVVLRRRLYFLPPGKTDHEPPWITQIVAFTPEGSLLP